MNTNGARAIAVMSGCVLLAACGGGGGGGVTSTPTPPPTPPATYTKIADLSGNQTFQTAGITYTSTPAAISNGASQAFGAGTVVGYNESTDTYTVTEPGGTSQSFAPSNVQSTSPNSVTFSKTVGQTTENLTLTTSVTLSYAMFGSWVTVDNQATSAKVRLAVGGSPTLSSDMPKTGSASYSLGLGGSARQSQTSYLLAGNSTGTLTADFAAGTVNTTVNLGGAPQGGGAVTSLGSFSGSGTIASGGPGYTGTLNGATGSGLYSGAFFGPQAVETALNFYVAGTNFSAVGQGGGVKQ